MLKSRFNVLTFEKLGHCFITSNCITSANRRNFVLYDTRRRQRNLLKCSIASALSSQENYFPNNNIKEANTSFVSKSFGGFSTTTSKKHYYNIINSNQSNDMKSQRMSSRTTQPHPPSSKTVLFSSKTDENNDHDRIPSKKTIENNSNDNNSDPGRIVNITDIGSSLRNKGKKRNSSTGSSNVIQSTPPPPIVMRRTSPRSIANIGRNAVTTTSSSSSSNSTNSRLNIVTPEPLISTKGLYTIVDSDLGTEPIQHDQTHSMQQLQQVDDDEWDEETTTPTKSIKRANNNKRMKKDTTTMASLSPPTTTRSTSNTRTTAKKTTEVDQIEPPPGWEDVYNLVKELRSDRTAPCDIDGCEAIVDRTQSFANQRFQILIALMLSSQTKDVIVGNAVRAMQKDNVLSISAIHKMSHEQLNQYISKVGFHNTKTKHIKTVVQILHEQYNDDIPLTANEMIQVLPGVGPKMAYICETAAWKTCSGIGIDTHMNRLFGYKYLNWIVQKRNIEKTPEQTRVIIQSWLPYNKWYDLNILFVGFGQELQQQKHKLLYKVLYNCSKPYDGLCLLEQCGLDYRIECKKMASSTSTSNEQQQQQELETKIQQIMEQYKK